MVSNPNAAGNSGAAGEDANLWASLSSVKMKTPGAERNVATAIKETVDNKSFSLVTKFQAWRAQKAEERALKKYDKKFDKVKPLQSDDQETAARVGAAKAEHNLAKAARDINAETVKLYKQDLKDAKKEASFAEYAVDQGKRVFELMKAGGSVLKNTVRAYWKKHQTVKVSVADLMSEDAVAAYKQRAEGVKTEANNAERDKQAAIETYKNVKDGFADRKTLRENSVEAEKTAKANLERSKAELSASKKEEKEKRKVFEELDDDAKDLKKKFEKANKKCEDAKKDYEAAKEKTEQAQNRVDLAESIAKLREQLGKMDINKAKDAIAKKKEELIAKQKEIEGKVAVIAMTMHKMSGTDYEKDMLPVDKREMYHELIESAIGADQREVMAQNEIIKQQEAIIQQYEALKAQQAEKVAKSEPGKKGIRGFINGFFARKVAASAANSK